MYSLPKLNDGRSCVGVCDVGGIFSIVVDTVLCRNTRICDTKISFFNFLFCRRKMMICGCSVLSSSPPLTCIPVVSTASPGQLSGEAVEEVEDCPG